MRRFHRARGPLVEEDEPFLACLGQLQYTSTHITDEGDTIWTLIFGLLDIGIASRAMSPWSH